MSGVTSQAKESVGQLVAVWREIVRDRHSGEVRDLPGTAIRWADTKFAFFNMITFTDFGADSSLLSSRMEVAVDYLRTKTQPGLIWLFEDFLNLDARSELSTLAGRAGLSLALSGYGMAGEILPMPQPDHPDLTFIRVSTDEHVQTYADINAVAYRMPLEAVRDGLRNSTIWKTRAFAYLGIAAGRAVSAAAAIENEGSLFLALVATVPEAQRKGYGEAICRKVLYEAWKSTGLTSSVLHATEAGAPVYARIGYKKVARMGFYGLSEQ
jgi:GNAT superfamily N-acetyltransferase